jgi:O-antigen/teichoic acid export membrane protein
MPAHRMSISRNTGLNLTFNGLSLLVYLVTVPWYLELLGQAAFGVLTLIWLLVTYFRLFDFGLSRAVTQRLATVSADEESARRIVWTALLISVSIGLLGASLFWLSAPWTISQWPELRQSVGWLAAIIPLVTVTATLLGALQGRQQFLQMNSAMFIGLLLMQLAPLLVIVNTGGGLEQVIPIVVLARLTMLLVLLTLCGRQRLVSPRPHFCRTEARQILRFGAWAGVSSIINPMMTALDRFVIAAQRGAAAVPIYAVPFQLVERSLILATSLSEALYPRLSALTEMDARALTRRSAETLVMLLTPLSIGGLFLFEPILHWWIGPAFAKDSAKVGQWLIIGFWTNALASIPYAYLQARGRPDIVARFHLIEVLPYLVALYVGLQYWGLLGAAIAFGLRTTFDLLLLWRAAELGLSAAQRLVPSLLLLLVAFALAPMLSALSAPWWVAGGGLVLAAMALAWRSHAVQDFLGLVGRVN